MGGGGCVAGPRRGWWAAGRPPWSLGRMLGFAGLGRPGNGGGWLSSLLAYLGLGSRLIENMVSTLNGNSQLECGLDGILPSLSAVELDWDP